MAMTDIFTVFGNFFKIDEITKDVTNIDSANKSLELNSDGNFYYTDGLYMKKYLK